MDRRTVLAIVLSLGVYYLWLGLRGPAVVPPEEPTPTEEPAAAPQPTAQVAPAAASVPPVTDLPLRSVQLHACGAKGTVSSDGGRLHGVTLDDYSGSFDVTPLYSWVVGRVTGSKQGSWEPYGTPNTAMPLSDQASALSAGVGDVATLPMQFVSPSAEAGDGPTNQVELVGTTPEGIEVRKVLAEHREPDGGCWVDVTVTWSNRTDRPYRGALWVAVQDHPHVAGRYDEQQPMAYVDDGLYYGGSYGAGWFGCSGTRLTDDFQKVPLEGPVSWFGQSDRYFGFFLTSTPGSAQQGALSLQRSGTGDASMDGGVIAYDSALAPNESRSERFRAYVGPLVSSQLASVHPDLPQAIDLGFWALFGYPLLWLLRAFHGVAGNWGIAIILLTVAVKAAFFNLTQRSLVAGEKMRKLQPELNAVKEQYKDNPQELQRRQMEVMQKHQVNPLSGCLPMLIQMPVWLALNQVLLTSVDLHHAHFLYLRDLTAADPYLLLPVVITALMWLQQQLTPMSGLDPTQQQVMRYMPLLFGLMFFAFPSGLAVYVLVNLLLSIVQQWFFRRSVGADTAPAAATG